MRELLLNSLILSDSGGRLRSYRYYITVDEVEAGSLLCESYGIRIEEQGGQQAFANHLTCSASRMEQLANTLVRNQVTPIGLADVIDDWL